MYTKKYKDPNAPKRARGSYVFFTLDARPEIIKENPQLKFTEVGHVMGERWRALSAEEKRKYEDLANDDKKRVTEEMAAYNALKPPEPESVAVVGGAHPQYQEAQQYAEQYYAQQDATAAAAAPDTGYTQYYAHPGSPPDGEDAEDANADTSGYHYA